MFQPTHTPLFYSTCYGVANANIPDYTFASTPLGQGYGGGGSGSGGGASSNGLNPGAVNVYASPIFSSLVENNTNHNNHHHNHHNHTHNLPQRQFPDEGYSPSHDCSKFTTHRLPTRLRNVKMEPPSDLAQQEAAARDYQPELSVGSLLCNYHLCSAAIGCTCFRPTPVEGERKKKEKKQRSLLVHVGPFSW